MSFAIELGWVAEEGADLLVQVFGTFSMSFKNFLLQLKFENFVLFYRFEEKFVVIYAGLLTVKGISDPALIDFWNFPRTSC